MRGMSYFLLMLLLFPLVSAVAVSPASSSFTNPNQESLVLRVINDYDVNATLSITVDDEHGILTLNDTSLRLQTGNPQVRLHATVTAPSQLLPGEYVARILIEQQAEPTQDFVSATPAIRHVVRVLVPAEGIFVDSEIVMSSADVHEPMSVGVVTRNVGTQTVELFQVLLRILDPQGSVVHEYVSDTVVLATTESRQFTTEWTPRERGEYVVIATVLYDGAEQERTRTFEVGALHLELGELFTGPYRYGEILRLDVPVTSEWNQPLRNVHATMRVYKNGLLVDSFMTPRIDLPAFGQGVVSGFWNTQGADFGRYDIVVVVEYATKSTMREYSIVIGADGIVHTREGFSMGWQLYLALLLVAVGIAYVIYRKLSET